MIYEFLSGQVQAGRFFQGHGYLTAILVVAAEFSGVPVPAGLALLFLSAFADALGLSPAALALIAVPAALTPETIWFMIGRRRGLGLIRFYCKATLGSRSCTERTSLFFSRLGPKALLIAKFVPGLSSFATPMAGLSGIPFSRFWLWNGLGTLLWSSSWVASGRVIGPRFALDQIAVIHGDGERLISILAALFAAYLGMKLFARARRGLADAGSLS